MVSLLTFQKHFWQCWYHILIKKLNKYGIKGSSVLWFKRDLHNCKNYTTFNNKCTTYETATCGIPQRFILEPLLFLIYVNDLPNVSKLLDPIMFSDDTNLFFFLHHNIRTLFDTVNNELTKIRQCFIATRLSLNAKKKTKYTLFSEKLG